VLVLVASGLKLLGVGTITLAWILVSALVIGPLAWAVTRIRHGFAPLASMQRKPLLAGDNQWNT
jgi:hypothetical protein